MKKGTLITCCTILILLLSSCGIPQEEYDSMVAERDTVKNQVASLQSDLNKAKDDLHTVENSLTTAENELNAKQNELTSLQEELAVVESQVSSARSQLSTSRSQVTRLQQELEEAKLPFTWSVFCSSIKDYGDFVKQPGATYQQGDTVWLYFEIAPLASRKVGDDTWEQHVIYKSMALFGPNGEELMSYNPNAEIFNTTEKPELFGWFTSYVDTTSEMQTGDYRLECVVIDLIADTTVLVSGKFTLE